MKKKLLRKYHEKARREVFKELLMPKPCFGPENFALSSELKEHREKKMPIFPAFLDLIFAKKQNSFMKK